MQLQRREGRLRVSRTIGRGRGENEKEEQRDGKIYCYGLMMVRRLRMRRKRMI